MWHGSELSSHWLNPSLFLQVRPRSCHFDIDHRPAYIETKIFYPHPLPLLMSVMLLLGCSVSGCLAVETSEDCVQTVSMLPAENMMTTSCVL